MPAALTRGALSVRSEDLDVVWWNERRRLGSKDNLNVGPIALTALELAVVLNLLPPTS